MLKTMFRCRSVLGPLVLLLVGTSGCGSVAPAVRGEYFSVTAMFMWAKTLPPTACYIVVFGAMPCTGVTVSGLDTGDFHDVIVQRNGVYRTAGFWRVAGQWENGALRTHGSPVQADQKNATKVRLVAETTARAGSATELSAAEARLDSDLSNGRLDGQGIVVFGMASDRSDMRLQITIAAPTKAATQRLLTDYRFVRVYGWLEPD